MGVLADTVKIVASQYGWIIVALYMWYEISWPLWQTKVQGAAQRFEDKLDAIDDKHTTLTQVVRAMVRVQDNPDRSIDVESVDSHLVENGVEPESFIDDRGIHVTVTDETITDEPDSGDTKRGYE